MKAIELYDELQQFYEIRGDKIGYYYLLDFIELVTKEKVLVKDFMKWYKTDRKKLGVGLKPNTIKNYNVVLKQFIRYLTAVDGLEEFKKKPIKVPEKVKTTKIHDTFHDFKKDSDNIIENV